MAWANRILMVIGVCLIDAIPSISRRMNGAGLIITSLLVTVCAIYWTVTYVEDDVVYVFDIPVALHPRIAGSWRILAIFIWKSTIKYVYRTRWAVFVKPPYKARIIWKSDESIKKLMTVYALNNTSVDIADDNAQGGDINTTTHTSH